MLKPSQHSLIYQIWPRSFKDSNGDGIGDLKGIIQTLDYLKDLGVDYLWLSPIYVSPNHDYGYDIQDYRTIQPEFGTMEDFDELIQESRKRSIGIIMDWVANHTSDQHPWYQEAISRPNSDKRDFYFFREGKDGKEPNNWISLFGGSAWTKVDDSLYSLNLFTPQQKDLNWANPQVRQEMRDVLSFWLDKGVSGFRMDVVNMIAKEPGLPDQDPHKKGYQFAKDRFVSLPLSHTYLNEVYEKVLKNQKGLFIGEGLLINPESASRYSGLDSHELDLMFHFDLALLGCGPLGKYDFRKFYHWTTRDFKKVYFKWQLASVQNRFMLGNFLSNHDQPRAVSRYGDDQMYHTESAKALMALTLFSKGTPFIYQGEEIGMTNLKLEPKDWKDFEAINDYTVLQTMMHLPAWLAKKVIQKMTRDQARTPMQWSSDDQAGFSTQTPWMIVNPNYKTVNVDAQLKDPQSILNFTKKAIQLFKESDVWTFGELIPHLLSHSQIIAFERLDSAKNYIVLINLSHKVATFKAEKEWCLADVCLTNQVHYGPMVTKMVFAPYECRVLEVKARDKSVATPDNKN